MRSIVIAWLAFTAGYVAIVLGGPGSELPVVAPERPPIGAAIEGGRCGAGSSVALDQAFDVDAERWPREWEIGGEGEAFVEDGAGQLVAEPGKRVRVTLRRPVQWTEVHIEVRFSDFEPQAFSLVDHGPDGEGFVLSAFRRFDEGNGRAPKTDWLVGAVPASRRIGAGDDGPYARAQWIRLRARPIDGGRAVQWRRALEGQDSPPDWLDLMQTGPSAGQLALVFEQGREAEQNDALRIERVVICEAAPGLASQ